MERVVSDRRLWIAGDGKTVVEEGDERAAILATACAGSESTDERVVNYLKQVWAKETKRISGPAEKKGK